MKDLLLKLQFSLVNCRGQCYNGASNLMGHKTGVPKIIQDIQPTDQSFDQPGFDTYAKMDSLLFKTLNSQEKSEELKIMEKLYHDDANISMSTGQFKTAQAKSLDFWLHIIVSLVQ